MIIAVDTNVLIDSLSDDPDFGDMSREALGRAFAEGRIVICEIVYSELAGQLSEEGELSRYLTSSSVELVPSTKAALELAGHAWTKYARTRRAGVVCPECGTSNRMTCSGCASVLRLRQHLLSDFIIGAHASVHADRLLTRDRGYYRRYFPGLTILDPSA